MFSINDDDIQQLEHDLRVAAERAIPFATRNTVHSAAVKGRYIAVENVRHVMITRNKFTEKSVLFHPSKSNQITLAISRQEATLGSTADYMEDQEFGGVKTAKGKGGVSIATSYSANQGQSQPRTRLSVKGNKMENIRLRKRTKRGRTRKQRNFNTIKEAATSGNKFVFLDLGRTKGIFKVVGGKRRTKINMVHSMSKKSVVIPRNPWLLPAVKQTAPHIPAIYKKSLEFQANRLGLFK